MHCPSYTLLLPGLCFGPASSQRMPSYSGTSFHHCHSLFLPASAFQAPRQQNQALEVSGQLQVRGRQHTAQAAGATSSNCQNNTLRCYFAFATFCFSSGHKLLSISSLANFISCLLLLLFCIFYSSSSRSFYCRILVILEKAVTAGSSCLSRLATSLPNHTEEKPGKNLVGR